jgi:hypothetical protein
MSKHVQNKQSPNRQNSPKIYMNIVLLYSFSTTTLYPGGIRSHDP